MKLCNDDCIPCCDFCFYAKHGSLEKDATNGPIGCKLHKDQEHQDIAEDCGYCDDFFCFNCDELESCDFENCVHNCHGYCIDEKEYENCKFMEARNEVRFADECIRKLKEQYEFERPKKSRDCIVDNIISITKLDEYGDEVKTIYAKEVCETLET